MFSTVDGRRWMVVELIEVWVLVAPCSCDSSPGCISGLATQQVNVRDHRGARTLIVRND